MTFGSAPTHIIHVVYQQGTRSATVQYFHVVWERVIHHRAFMTTPVNRRVSCPDPAVQQSRWRQRQITRTMEFYLEPSWQVCTLERCANAARNSQDAQQDALHGPNRATPSQTEPNRASQNPTVPPASYPASFCSGMH